MCEEIMTTSFRGIPRWTICASVATALLLAVACGGNEEADTGDRPELQGFSAADVDDIIARDDTAYSSVDEQVQALQQVAKGWAACRDVYGIYADWIRTGELGPPPEPHLAEADIDATNEPVLSWIEDLYAPLRDGDPQAARELLEDDMVCGFVPVEAEGDRSSTIADALAEG
jgi:hypothetical protein